MNDTFFDLIDQTYEFPQEGFDLEENQLRFHGINLKALVEKHGSPLKLTYLPKIQQQIRKARKHFNVAIAEHDYQGLYQYCYCTKSSHFHHVINTALKENVCLETSSAFDIDLIENLYNNGKVNTDKTVVHNGFKTANYLRKIKRLHEIGFTNTITVLDNMEELDDLAKLDLDKPMKIGVRICINEEPRAHYYTSRMGINRRKIVDFVKERIADNPDFELKMVHFFVDSGVADNFYYWGEFQKAVNIFTQIKAFSPSLTALNIGGGFPIRNSLSFEYEFGYMTSEIVRNIKEACRGADVAEPNIYTEFGRYTVGESGAVIFKVLRKKQQNDAELWYIIDNSLMNTIPDAWSIDEKFILLPINKWHNRYRRVNIGGISCDHSDYYNSGQFNQPLLLPHYNDEENEPLYLGFFHTGAYQDAISGYGGIKHCLIPAPKHVIIDRTEDGQVVDSVFRNEQEVDNMLQILGYHDQ